MKAPPAATSAMNARCASRRRRGRGLRPVAGRLHGMPQSLVEGAPHRRAARQIGKHHAIATAAAIRCVTATPPSSSMCRGRVLRLRHPGERWRGSPRPAAVDAQGQPLTAAGAACGQYLSERLRAGRDRVGSVPACLPDGAGRHGIQAPRDLYRGGRFRHWVKIKNRAHPAFGQDQF